MQSYRLPSRICNDIEKTIRRFIWGNSLQTHGIPLVNWNTLTQPKSHGGLGVKDLGNHNIAFLMKICYSLVNSTRYFWIRLLRHKYKKTEASPTSIHRSSASHLWRALTKILPAFSSFLSWSIADGSSVHFWYDKWIPGLPSLSNFRSNRAVFNEDIMVQDVTLHNGFWNLSILNQLLVPEVVQHIQNGRGSSQMICLVLFVAPVKNQRCTSFGIATSPSTYGILSSQISILPIFSPYPLINGSYPTLAQLTSSQANYYAKAPPQTVYLSRHLEAVQWMPAPNDWISLNTDGVVNYRSSLSTAGGIIRNYEGTWLVGFNKYIGRSTILQDELCGIYEGLKLAWNYGYNKVQCQTDSVEAFHLITSSTSPTSPISLIRTINQFTSKNWLLEYKLI
ncbi:hypothetical protein F3Y22_tig00117016pilonHSYRG00344 [Hibiscus syriacus]|uniref:RNase H type-1 domain-containing protein n=1 Tax=Hibiscus syriacus TaxID=106335 RepID=A0A6A2XPS4_HIBSY|nr:hypothetical protein F3Y22_tig00117016pilonHSYRG00344 [Hibiscus syriacus]